MNTSPDFAKPWVKWSVIFGFWTLLALFFASRDYFTWVDSSWAKALWWKAMEWYGWAILSLGVFWVCGKCFEPSKSWWRYVAIHLFSGTLFAILHVGICSIGALIEAKVLNTGRSWPFLFKVTFNNHFHFDWLVYLGIVGAWHVLDYSKKFHEREVLAAGLEVRLARAQLQTLKTQLQPHFLFNTLHSISSLNYDDPKAANRMLARLSSLLRLTLEKDSAQEVSLKEELEFLQHYLEIEQIRLGDRLTIKMDIAPETLDAAVPSLLLQPIVENAIRHGIAPYATPGQLSIAARRDTHALCLEVSDNGPGLAGTSISSGVGLPNTRERLYQLYAKDARLELANRESGGLVVRVLLFFHRHVAADQTTAYEMEYENSHINRG